MEQHENKEESKRHVIEKIRRISIAMDRGESRTWILLTGLFTVIVLGLMYFFFL
ncbi:MAG TPA: hypothetical protein VFU05_11685 [Cyclobacteriaceae bacterium]|nr:hypothetical protein [Cyclobacteriaceae bacterium]